MSPARFRWPFKSRLVAAAALVSTALAVGCSEADLVEEELASPPPILLISCEALRADAVRALAGPRPVWPHLRTPNLDALVAQADWAGRGVAPSTETFPALASLLSGLQPWQHQALGARPPSRLPESTFTLAEALGQSGYRTIAYVDGRTLVRGLGYQQGFEKYQRLGGGGRTRARLAQIGKDPEFVWIHLTAPLPPYRTWATGSGEPQRRIRARHFERFLSPEVPLSEGQKRRILRAYSLTVAAMDRELGSYLEALKKSGQWDRSLVIFTSAHGEEFGENSQIGHGNNLGRAALEVPVIIKLPASLRGRLAVPRNQRIATTRLWATAFEAAGGRSSPALAPSLFREVPGGILSELYQVNGSNYFSFLEGEEQLIRRTSFSPRAAQYFAARRRSLGKASGSGRDQVAERIRLRQEKVFSAAPPFTGPPGGAEVSLRRWTPAGEIPLVDDQRLSILERGLEEAWTSFLDRERSPGDEARWRNESR